MDDYELLIRTYRCGVEKNSIRLGDVLGYSFGAILLFTPFIPQLSVALVYVRFIYFFLVILGLTIVEISKRYRSRLLVNFKRTFLFTNRSFSFLNCYISAFTRPSVSFFKNLNTFSMARARWETLFFSSVVAWAK